MKKNKKFTLDTLKVKSFITLQSEDDKNTIKSGILLSDGPPTTSVTFTVNTNCRPDSDIINCDGSYNCSDRCQKSNACR